MKKSVNIYIVSDATGTTAESVLTSVLVQFKRAQFNIVRFPFTKTHQQVEEILKKAEAGNCIIIFTLVSEKLRDLLIREGKKKRLTLVDVMGPLIGVFTSLLQHTPKMKPGVFRRQSEDMFRLVEAIHFTLLHDDGLGMDSIEQAELIILGVSRTGKTPTSIYLSCRRVKVANIPIIKGVPFPKKIAHMPVKKVGFLIDMERLVQLRSERARHMSYAGVPHYSSKSAIFDELDYCDSIYSRIPLLQTIDVTNRSIEEISEWITRNVL